MGKQSCQYTLPQGTRGWVVSASTAQGKRAPWHSYRMHCSSTAARSTGSSSKSVILATCMCRPGCVLWSEISPTKHRPTYSLISPCPIAPPQEQTDRQPQAKPKPPKPLTLGGIGEGVLSNSEWGEQNTTNTDKLSSALGATSCSCKMSQNLLISLRHCWTMQTSSSRSSLPEAGDSAALPSWQQRWWGRSWLLNSPTN